MATNKRQSRHKNKSKVGRKHPSVDMRKVQALTRKYVLGSISIKELVQETEALFQEQGRLWH